jgi:hypothetical protein
MNKDMKLYPKKGNFITLVNKYFQYCTNPDVNIKWAVHCINGDSMFLDEKLALLHRINIIIKDRK